MPRRNRGRERLNSGGEWKCYRISCRSPECGRVGHTLPPRSSPARDEGATGAFCSCGIYRNRTPDTPAFLPKRKSDHIQQEVVFQLHPCVRCPAGWTCGFARFRTLKYPAGIPIPHFCARAGALPIGKAEAATASQNPIEIKAFGKRPGRTCGSDRVRTSRKPLNVASVRART